MTEIDIYFNTEKLFNVFQIENKNMSKALKILFMPTYKQQKKAKQFHTYNISFNNSSGISFMQLPVALLSCITETTDRDLKS